MDQASQREGLRPVQPGRHHAGAAGAARGDPAPDTPAACDERARARALHALRARQRAWAHERGLEVDDAGWLADASENLLHPLDAGGRVALEASADAPLGEPGKPAPAAALDSTWALVWNALAPFRSDAAPLARALGGEGSALSLACAAGARGPDPADGEPPELHARIDGGPRPIALHATFAEPYASARPAPPAARPAAPLVEVLARPLPGCAHLARDRAHGPRRWRHVPVRALLERVAVLTAEHGPRGFRLALLWYDAPGRAGRRHARELARLRMRIGGEVELAIVSWQALLLRLGPLAGEETLRRYGRS